MVSPLTQKQGQSSDLLFSPNKTSHITALLGHCQGSRLLTRNQTLGQKHLTMAGQSRQYAAVCTKLNK